MNRADLRRLFEPRAVAVYGASSDPAKIGGRPLDLLKNNGYGGALYPINPNHARVQDLEAHASAASIPGPVDLAIVAVPAPQVLHTLEDCAAKGVAGAVVLTSGFAEAGGDGAARQRRIEALAKDSGMRVVGPNCMGIINMRVGLLGTFTPSAAAAAPGGVSVVSQSGAFGGYCLALMRQRGIGLGLWITTGNQCDVDFADCVRYYAEDEGTRVIVGYLEAVADSERLVGALALARERGKPVVVMKVGSSEAGAQAAVSHTASLAGADAVYDGVLRQYGAYRARSIDELFDVAYACAASRTRPGGDRLGIVTVSGGVGVLMADTAAQLGLELPPMPEDAQRELKQLLPFAGTRNPVDATAQIVNDVSLFEKNLALVLERGGYDAVIAFLSSVGLVKALNVEIAAQLRKLRARFPDRLVVMCALATPEVRALYEAEGVMLLEEPTRAVRAVAALRHFAREHSRAQLADPPPPLPAGALPVPAEALNEMQAKRLLAAAGIPAVAERLAASEHEALQAARELGYPVALKIASADIAHKSDIGGVLLGVASDDAVREGFRAVLQRARAAAAQARVDGVVVARMAPKGVETILGVQRDPVFGPVVMFGLGGVFVEAFEDVALRRAPFGLLEARAMIDQVKGRVLLRGVRGQPPADEEALAQALSRLSVFAADNEARIESVDINPFIVLPRGQGALAVDALIVPRRRGAPA